MGAWGTKRLRGHAIYIAMRGALVPYDVDVLQVLSGTIDFESAEVMWRQHGDYFARKDLDPIYEMSELPRHAVDWHGGTSEKVWRRIPAFFTDFVHPRCACAPVK